jgi:prepilin-type N-terminal cleavage/methylation domain-containing protein
LNAREAKTRVRRRYGAGGFTLIEMMVALTIVALLFAIGVPMFRNASLGARLSAGGPTTSSPASSSRAARRSSATSGELCASSDGATLRRRRRLGTGLDRHRRGQRGHPAQESLPEDSN